MNEISRKILGQLRDMKPRFDELGLKRVRVFGSVARGDATEESDVDLLVEFKKNKTVTLFTLGGLYSTFSGELERDVDIVMPDSIYPQLRDNILNGARDV